MSMQPVLKTLIILILDYLSSIANALLTPVCKTMTGDSSMEQAVNVVKDEVVLICAVNCLPCRYTPEF